MTIAFVLQQEDRPEDKAVFDFKIINRKYEFTPALKRHEDLILKTLSAAAAAVCRKDLITKKMRFSWFPRRGKFYATLAFAGPMKIIRCGK